MTTKTQSPRQGRRWRARLPNGRLSRAGTEAGIRRIILPDVDTDPARTVIDARCRHHGLSKAAARSPLAGYALGRLTLAGHLTRRQHDAALEWVKLRGGYLAAIEARRLFRHHPPETPSDRTHEDFCAAAIGLWEGTVLPAIASGARAAGLQADAVTAALESLAIAEDDAVPGRAGAMARMLGPVLDRLADALGWEPAEKSA